MRSAAACLVLLLVAACGRAGEPARFSGSAAEPRVGADGVTEARVLPAGADVLGTAWSRCEGEERVRELDGALLKDVACSEALLVAALREKAAGVGGDLLVERRCVRRASGEGERLSCRARVARRGEPRRVAPAPRSSASLYAPSEAWRILVDFEATGAGEGREARDEGLVDDVAVIPASQVPYGDIVARCDGECSRAAVRDAVRATAARVGADGVVGVACGREDGRWACLGTAAVYELDPERHPEAR